MLGRLKHRLPSSFFSGGRELTEEEKKRAERFKQLQGEKTAEEFKRKVRA